MIEIGPQMYTYALFIVMNAMVLALILVVYFIRNIHSSVLSPRLFQAYFVLGEIGWLLNARNAVSGDLVSTDNSQISFMLCTYLLLLAVYKPFQHGAMGRMLPLFHVVLGAFFLFFHDANIEIIAISTYSVVIYAFIAWLCFKRALALNNIGHAIVGSAAIIIIVNSATNPYIVIVLQDLSLMGGLTTIAMAANYTLIGIGFLASILINEQRELELLSMTDPLTDIFNRRGLEKSIKELKSGNARDKRNFCVISLDLDHFKDINDTYGHDAGDLVLKSVARLISEGRRQSDICARIGGEEFVIVLPNIRNTEASMIAESLRAKLQNTKVIVGAGTVTVTASFGVASHKDSFDLEALLQRADKAMYRAKQSGRNKVCAFNPDMEKAA
jgi:diguanylate cyclase (GGDEF)-like protein